MYNHSCVLISWLINFLVVSNIVSVLAISCFTKVSDIMTSHACKVFMFEIYKRIEGHISNAIL